MMDATRANDADAVTLEQLIDRHGLRNTLETIATICSEKASHIEANWQDRATARPWAKDARTLDAAAAKLTAS